MTERHLTLHDMLNDWPFLRPYFAEIKQGGITPERIRQMAREIVPDVVHGEPESKS